MRSRKLTNAMTNIDDKMIESASESRRTMNLTKWGAVAAAFVLIFTGVFALIMQNNTPAANTVIAFDVNPSMELEVSQDEKIVSVKALNEDAEKVLADLKLENVDLKTAVRAIVGSMLEHGYISINQNSILVSVKSGDTDAANELQRLVREDITSLLGEKEIDASVITQPYEENKEVEKKAEENHISVAKATLIERIINAGITDANGVPYTYEALAALKINELKLLMESKKLAVGGIDTRGNASSGLYITKEAAAEKALQNAGLTADVITGLEIEMDFGRGRMLYEIEFDHEGIEYEYELDAITGEIVKHKQEKDDDDDKDEPITEAPATDRNAAIDKALSEAGLSRNDVKELKVELKKENGVLIYEVEFETKTAEYEYKINATDGTVVNSNIDKDEDDDAVTDTVALDKDAAIGKALADAGLTREEVRELEAELERKKDVLFYEIEFETDAFEYEYKVSANDGTIIKANKEPADD